MLYLLATLFTNFISVAADVRVIAGSRVDIASTVANERGDSYLAVRGAHIEFRSPDGTAGQGSLCIVFEPTQGFFYVSVAFAPRPSFQTPCEYLVSGRWRYAVTAERLIGFTWAGGMLVCESTDRAGSIAEAENMALQWSGVALQTPSRRLSDIAVRPCEWDKLRMSQDDFPPEFFEFRGRVPSPFNRFAGPLPVRLSELARKKDGFQLVVESIPFGRRAALTVWRSNRGEEMRIVPDTTQILAPAKYWTRRSEVAMLPDDPETKRWNEAGVHWHSESFRSSAWHV